MVRVRYIVNDVEESIAFYVSTLGFEVVQDFSPNMAILKLGDLTLGGFKGFKEALKGFKEGFKGSALSLSFNTKRC